MPELRPYLQRIISYYDATWIDYRVLWLNKKNLSIHFGYFDEGVQKHHQALERLNEVMAAKVNIGAEDVVLDAGCGQGGSSLWLAQHKGAHVNGITLVPHQVAIAKKTAKKRKLDGLTAFHVADYCNTPFPDESFSVIWACESMCHAEHKVDFYKEAMRLLRPGGRLVVADYLRRDRPLSAQGEAMLHDWLHRWMIHDIDTWQEHEKNMLQCGFHNIKMEDCSAKMKPSLRHLNSMSSKLLPVGKILLRVGLRNAVNHGNHLGSISQYKAFINDYWFYCIFVAEKPQPIDMRR
jgi:tocopherol O-methyltransferase